MPLTGFLPRPLRESAAFRTTFTSLEEKEYAWFIYGNLCFFMAMQMQFVLRAFLAFELTGKASALGLVSVGAAVPMLVLAPLGGVIADRINKRTLLIVTQTAAAAVSLVTSILILTDLIAYWHLFALAFTAGSVFSLNMPARQALVPLLVPQHKLMNAISLQMGGMNVTRIIAPAAAGLLIAPVGVGWVYLFTFLLFCVAVASEFRLPSHGLKTDVEPEGFVQELLGGFRYISHTPVIAMLLFSGLLLPFFAFPVQIMLPVFAADVFGHGDGTGLGLLMAAGGVGGLVGAAVTANLDQYQHKGRLMFFGAVLMGSFLVAFTSTRLFPLALVFIAASNIGQMVFMSSNNTVVQAITPPEFRGRVMSVNLMSFGVMPLGVLPITAAADEFGPAWAIGVSSAVLVILAITAFLTVPVFRRLRLEPLSGAELSPVQAATLVAEGKISQQEADRLTGRLRSPLLASGPAEDAGRADAPGELGDGSKGQRGSQLAGTIDPG